MRACVKPACSRTATSSGARPRPAAHEGRAEALTRARQRNYRSSPLPHLGRRTHARARPVRLQHSAVLAYLTDCAPADLGDGILRASPAADDALLAPHFKSLSLSLSPSFSPSISVHVPSSLVTYVPAFLPHTSSQSAAGCSKQCPCKLKHLHIFILPSFLEPKLACLGFSSCLDRLQACHCSAASVLGTSNDDGVEPKRRRPDRSIYHHLGESHYRVALPAFFHHYGRFSAGSGNSVVSKDRLRLPAATAEVFHLRLRPLARNLALVAMARYAERLHSPRAPTAWC
ncbi:hypothetical protein C8J57DRAFT_1730279 [Mycena rebaudengoi]|nr:hypothetical protein C8J57DRAFT_1730279 [Mycena rebaudengoi]